MRTVRLSYVSPDQLLAWKSQSKYEYSCTEQAIVAGRSYKEHKIHRFTERLSVIQRLALSVVALWNGLVFVIKICMPFSEKLKHKCKEMAQDAYYGKRCFVYEEEGPDMNQSEPKSGNSIYSSPNSDLKCTSLNLLGLGEDEPPPRVPAGTGKIPPKEANLAWGGVPPEHTKEWEDRRKVKFTEPTSNPSSTN